MTVIEAVFFVSGFSPRPMFLVTVPVFLMWSIVGHGLTDGDITNTIPDNFLYCRPLPEEDTRNTNPVGTDLCTHGHLWPLVNDAKCKMRNINIKCVTYIDFWGAIKTNKLICISLLVVVSPLISVVRFIHILCRSSWFLGSSIFGSSPSKHHN